jgi:RNA polymerase sigma-70 factor (ECF subfamily)
MDATELGHTEGTQCSQIDVMRLAAGDHEEFRRLFMKYFPRVRQVVSAIVKSPEVAEDVTQDVFEFLWANRDVIPPLKSLDAYLFRMAKNKSINAISRRRIEEEYLAQGVNGREYYIDEEVHAREIELLVNLTVSRMPSQRKMVFELSRNDGLKNAEIAQRLNISGKTVENHLNLALRELRRITGLT